MVGVTRLELATPSTPCWYASQLRYTPNEVLISKKGLAKIKIKSTIHFTQFRYFRQTISINNFLKKIKLRIVVFISFVSLGSPCYKYSDYCSPV